MSLAADVTLRRARPREATAVSRLAELSSVDPPAGELLVVEVDGAILAWLELGTGRCAADPFARPAQVLSLLERWMEREATSPSQPRGANTVAGRVRRIPMHMRRRPRYALRSSPRGPM